MKFEVTLRVGLAVLRAAESITIKNGVPLRLLNEPFNTGQRENTLRIQALPGRLNSADGYSSPFALPRARLDW
jgi:hypothetical protein